MTRVKGPNVCSPESQETLVRQGFLAPRGRRDIATFFLVATHRVRAAPRDTPYIPIGI